MAIRRWTIGAALALGALLTLLVASTAPAKQRAAVKAAVITDIGGLGDKGFNDLCKKGLDDAKAKLGASGRVFISKSAADYIPNLSTAARQGYNPIISCGFLLGGDVEKAANKFPSTNFGIVDFSQTFMKTKPKNVVGLTFKEQESGYLAGVAAAFASKTNNVSAVGGQAVPAVVAFLAGFKAGAKATRPGIKVQSGYSESFTDQAKCKEIALNQIAAGSDAVFAAAGSCGLGSLQAAKEKGVWGIGVDNDQSFLGTFILTSATKKVDVAVFRTIEGQGKGTLKTGTDSVFSVGNGGVGFGKVSAKYPKRTALIAKLTAVSKQIASGKIVPPRK